MEVGECVDDREPDAPPGVHVMAHRRRHVVPDHDAAAVLDHEEVRPDDAVVVAEQVAARCPVVVLRQRVNGAVLAPHVVCSGSELAERRPSHDQLAVAEAHQVRQVRRAVRELQHVESAV